MNIPFPRFMLPSKSTIERRKERSKCDEDSGERTNTKLHDQPFYHRGQHGKMKRY